MVLENHVDPHVCVLHNPKKVPPKNVQRTSKNFLLENLQVNRSPRYPIEAEIAQWPSRTFVSSLAQLLRVLSCFLFTPHLHFCGKFGKQDATNYNKLQGNKSSNFEFSWLSARRDICRASKRAKAAVGWQPQAALRTAEPVTIFRYLRNFQARMFPQIWL